MACGLVAVIAAVYGAAFWTRSQNEKTKWVDAANWIDETVGMHSRSDATGGD